MNKAQHRKVRSLISRHVRHGARARELFKKAAAALDQVIAIGAEINQPIDITVRNGKEIVARRVVIHDQFEKKNTAFGAKAFQRYSVDDYKPKKDEHGVAV
jgi:hypothetical protein